VGVEDSLGEPPPARKPESTTLPQADFKIEVVKEETIMAGIRISYFAVIGFVTQLLGIISTVDENSDGKVDGKEKLRAAKRATSALLQAFPNLSGKLGPEKIEALVNKLVEALDIIVKE
jgi:hypothetical protein